MEVALVNSFISYYVNKLNPGNTSKTTGIQSNYLAHCSTLYTFSSVAVVFAGFAVFNGYGMA